MNKMSKGLEYYRIGQNKSDENIIQMWIQHCLNLDEMNYIFVGALRNNRLELCSRLYNIGCIDNFTPSIDHAEYAVTKEARDFLKKHLVGWHPDHIDLGHGLVGKCRVQKLEDIKEEIDRLPQYEKYMLIPLLRGSAENKDISLFKYILEQIDENVYIFPDEFEKMLKWIIMNNFEDKLRLILERWDWLKNDEKYLKFINK
jgi:hypothetical protein